MQMELTPEEREVIVEALESVISDLRAEISHTDRLDFRNMLKFRRDALNKLLTAIKAED